MIVNQIARKAIAKKDISVKVRVGATSLFDLTPATFQTVKILKGTALEAWSSFFPFGSRVWHTKVVHEGRDIVVKTASLNFL